MRKLKIALVTQSYHPVVGGIGEHVRHLALSLRNRGHEVEILTAGPSPAEGEVDDLPVTRVGRRIRIPSNGSRASIAIHPDYRFALRRWLDRPRDLIHLHSPLEPFLPWAVLRAARQPVIGTFHNAGSVHWGYRYFGFFLDRVARRLAMRTAVSRCAALYAGRHFPGQYLVLPNGVDPGRFRPPETHSDGRPATVLFVGCLEPRKGLDILVDGVARAREILASPIRLLVVGDGSRRNRLLRRARRAGVDLVSLGRVEDGKLADCYRQADLLVAPATHGESFGIVLLEALASGLPVVASRIEGFAELLDGCRVARLFPVGEPDALADRIAECLSVFRGREETTQMARSFALLFAWGEIAEATEEVYGEALGGAPARLERIRVTSKRWETVRTPALSREPEIRQA